MHVFSEDTVVALSSTHAGSTDAGFGRAILRLSGPCAMPFAQAVFEADRPWPAEGRSWQRVRGRLTWHNRALPAQAYIMPGPRSYTRQDVVELHLEPIPAAQQILGEILAQLLQAGARAALPGEFTRRASLNGRISPAQAEAIGRLLRAENADEARQWALRATAHAATDRDRLRKSIEELVALIELNLDFSAEDVELLSHDELGNRLKTLMPAPSGDAPSAETDLATGDGLLASALPRVVLAGPTNAGKSSLLNALAGRELALVSDRAHTTRDVVEADLTWAPGSSSQMVDTAGLGEALAADPARLLLDQALAQTRQAIYTADVLLVVFDRQNLEDAQRQATQLKTLIHERAPGAVIVVWSKTDLPPHAEWTTRRANIESELAPSGHVDEQACFVLSARTAAGLKPLRAHISQLILKLQGRLRAAQAAGEAAERQAMEAAREAVTRACQAHASGLGEDAVVVELREAVHALGRAQGVLLRHDALTESLLDRIFADFCIGK